MKRDNEREPGGCARVVGRLERLEDGGLSPLEEARDRGHLEACEGCRAELAGYRRLVEEVGRSLAVPGHEEALAGLGARLAAARPPGRGRRRARRAALVAAAAALLLLFLLDLAGDAPAWGASSRLQASLELPAWGAVLQATRVGEER